MTSHTIILAQPAKNNASRTYSDYDTVALAVEGLVDMYERKLKEMNPTVVNITYDISDLYKFIDHFADIAALVYDNKIKGYIPHDREWIKTKILGQLKRQAN